MWVLLHCPPPKEPAIAMDVLSIPATAEHSTHTAMAMPLPPSPVAGLVRTHGPNYPTMTQAMPELLLAELLRDAHTHIRSQEAELAKLCGELDASRKELVEFCVELGSREIERVKAEFEICDLKQARSVLEARAQSLSEQLRDLTAEHGPNTEDSRPHKIPATCHKTSGGLPFGYSPPAASMLLR